MNLQRERTTMHIDTTPVTSRKRTINQILIDEPEALSGDK